MIEQDDIKMNVNEKEKKSVPYYESRPQFSGQGPSKIKGALEKGIIFFLVIITGVVLYFILLRLDRITGVISEIFKILTPIMYGFAIAYLLNPIVKKVDQYLVPVLEKKTSKKKAATISRSVGIFAALIFMILLIIALFNMLVPELYKSIRDLIYTLPGQLNDMVNQFKHFQSSKSATSIVVSNIVEQGAMIIEQWLNTDLMGQLNTIMSNLTVGVINFINMITDFLIGMIVSVYVLFSKEKFSAQCKKMVYAFMSTRHANLVLHLTKKSNEIFGGFIIGKIIDSAIIGVLCFAGLSLLHMPYTLLVSVIVGVTNVIPFFGPYIGAIPSAILILLTDPKMGIYFLIFILFLQQLDGNVIGPKILGDSTGLSAFWVIFSILLGGGLFGFAGMILGVPTFAVIYYIVTMLTGQKLEKKHLPVATGCYTEKSYVDDEGVFVPDDRNEESK